MDANGLLLQETPRVFLASVDGQWLLRHTTPSWRARDPEVGFQRIVKEERARQIAVAVLDQRRTFPNAIVLATDATSIRLRGAVLEIPDGIRLLVVDGQHRLWAQRFSKFSAKYACVIHVGLTEVDMARLFIEINDNQRRVPSSLRWDLVRLVRPEEREHDVIAAELVFSLATEKQSPLYQRIDLTGEQKEIALKQGSIAPEIRRLLSRKDSPIRELDFQTQLDVLIGYLVAARSVDPDGWSAATSPLQKARVLRALLRLLPDVIESTGTAASTVTPSEVREVLLRLDVDALATDRIRAVQGSAGISSIEDELRTQLFGETAG